MSQNKNHISTTSEKTIGKESTSFPINTDVEKFDHVPNARKSRQYGINSRRPSEHETAQSQKVETLVQHELVSNHQPQLKENQQIRHSTEKPQQEKPKSYSSSDRIRALLTRKAVRDRIINKINDIRGGQKMKAQPEINIPDKTTTTPQMPKYTDLKAEESRNSEEIYEASSTSKLSTAVPSRLKSNKKLQSLLSLRRQKLNERNSQRYTTAFNPKRKLEVKAFTTEVPIVSEVLNEEVSGNTPQKLAATEETPETETGLGGWFSSIKNKLVNLRSAVTNKQINENTDTRTTQIPPFAASKVDSVDPFTVWKSKLSKIVPPNLVPQKQVKALDQLEYSVKDNLQANSKHSKNTISRADTSIAENYHRDTALNEQYKAKEQYPGNNSPIKTETVGNYDYANWEPSRV